MSLIPPPSSLTWLQGFQQLERHRIRDILLVSSLFDFYLFEEEGLLYEQIQSEYRGLQLSHTPEFTRVSSGAEAIRLLKSGTQFDLIITTLHIEDTTPIRLARSLLDEGITTPIVLLGYDNRELNDLITHQEISIFDRIFVWQGDFRLLIAVIKNLEDEWNVREDTTKFGVQCILLVEDNIRDASHFLPLLYAEIIQHSQRLMSEAVNAAHRSVRLRARPKILLRSTWEDAIACFDEFKEHITGEICDVESGAIVRLSVARESIIADHPRDVLLEFVEAGDRILPRRAKEDLRPCAKPHRAVRRVHRFRHQPLRVLNDLGVEQRQEVRCIADVVFDEKDALHSELRRVFADVPLVFEILDD